MPGWQAIAARLDLAIQIGILLFNLVPYLALRLVGGH
jgi:hypothetical protein